jgi:hypothetical protein
MAFDSFSGKGPNANRKGQHCLSHDKLEPNFHRISSRRLARALVLLYRAERQMARDSQAAPDRYHRNHLHCIASSLRDLSIPLMRIVSRLERGR